MKINIYFTLIFIITSFHGYSQVKEENTIMEMETEEIIVKITSDYNLTKSININMEVKHDILIPILNKSNFILEEGMLKYNRVFLSFPYDLEETGKDINADYKIISAGTKIDEKINLKELINPIDLYFTYSYINDSSKFEEVIREKSLVNYYVKMKWSTMKIKIDL